MKKLTYKKLNYNRIIIGFFVVILGLGGLFTLVFNIEGIGKTTYKSIKQGWEQSHSLLGLVTGAINGIETSVDEYVHEKEKYIDLYGLIERGLGRRYIRDANPSNVVVKDNHDILQFISFPSDDEKIANYIIELNKKLENEDIPLVYIQAPNKIIEGFTELPDSVVDYSNENVDAFLGRLKEGNVDCVDLRKEIEDSSIDKELIFYRTDHHWRNETAFWAFQNVVNTLREYIDLDEVDFYTNEENYNFITYEETFLGSQGRRVGRYYAGVDDYTLITPNFETDYEVTIHKSDGSRVYEGEFEKAILHEELLDMSESVYTNRYAAYFGGDYPEVVIKSRQNTDDKKVLIIKDSFALPFSAFLSTMVNETRLIDLRYFELGDLESYIDEFNPDVVLFMCKSVKTKE